MRNFARSLRGNLRRAINALAHEHAGEMLLPSGKRQILRGRRSRVAANSQSGQRNRG